MAAASAVLDVIEDEDLMANAATVGDALRARLSTIDHPRLGDVRGAGLYVGVEVVTDRDSKKTRPRGSPSTRQRTAREAGADFGVRP